MRTLVRSLTAAVLAAAPLLAGLASPVSAQVISPLSGTTRAVSQSPAVSVTSVTPSWIGPGSTITVSGTITNDTSSPISGISVQVQTSGGVQGIFPFPSRSAMEGFADGSTTSSYFLPDQAGSYSLPRTLHTRMTMRWSVSFPASAVSFGNFGVYPLEAVAYNAYGSPIATDPTLLPYWPGKGSAKPVSIAWVWPLISVPQTDACGTLATNSLARSLGGSGRLRTLLDAGVRNENADLTWAVDPALLANTAMMTKRYGVGAKAGADSPCEDITARPASAAATSWLTKLRTGTAGVPMFVTPYADVDISALAHAGLNADLQTAFSLGESVAQAQLHRSFGKSSDTAPSIAWPASGTADASVLLALADDNGPSTLLLGSDELPNATGTVAHTSSGVGTTDTLLLADSGMTSLLATASARSPAGAQFTLKQDFLAETAMIAAEYPNQAGRSLIVAPPQRWNPSATEAASLLSTTANVPWLHPTYLSSLATAKGDPQTLPGKHVSASELSAAYMSRVKSVDAKLATFKNLLYRPGSRILAKLEESVASTESSAWRGRATAGGIAALSRVASYLNQSLASVQMITNASGRILLAGASGSMLVSVRNNLNVPIRVGVRATVPPGSSLSVGKPGSPIQVLPGKTGTVRITVSSSDISTSTLKLQLVTANGSPLPNQVTTMNVQATRYGRELLILIAAALGVLVLTSAARRVRQWLNETGSGSGGTG